VGKRSGVPYADETIAKLTLAELDAEIARYKIRLTIPTTSYNKKSLTKRILWLTKLRDRRSESSE